jgi:hypothetical protein
MALFVQFGNPAGPSIDNPSKTRLQYFCVPGYDLDRFRDWIAGGRGSK